MSDFRKHLEEAKKDKEFLTEYEKLAPEYEIARQIIAARVELGITQKELADRVGTSQANISKLEHGQLNPSMQMLQKVAAGLGKTLSAALV